MLWIRGYQWTLVGVLACFAHDLQAQNLSLSPTSEATQHLDKDISPSQVSTLNQDLSAGDEDHSSDRALLFNITATQNFGAKKDVDTTTAFDFTGSYKVDERFSLVATQRITKLYSVDPEEDEIQAADTSLNAIYKLLSNAKPDAHDSYPGLSLKAGMTLPVSRFSQDQKVTTVASLSIAATQNLGKLRATLQPFFRYHLNQYKTLTKDDSGTTVVRYRMGLAAQLSAELPYSLDLSAMGQWTERAFEDPPYGSHPPEHDYSFDVTLSYILDEETRLSAGYSQGNRAEQLGNVNIYLFDDESTQYFVSLSKDL